VFNTHLARKYQEILSQTESVKYLLGEEVWDDADTDEEQDAADDADDDERPVLGQLFIHCATPEEHVLNHVVMDFKILSHIIVYRVYITHGKDKYLSCFKCWNVATSIMSKSIWCSGKQLLKTYIVFFIY